MVSRNAQSRVIHHISLQHSSGCYGVLYKCRVKDKKTFPPQFWKRLYKTAISEGPDLCMAAKAVNSEHKTLPDMTKRSLPHLSSHAVKALLGQNLLQLTQPSSSLKQSSLTSMTELRPMTAVVLGFNPPHSVVKVDQDKQNWLNVLHLIASHWPAHLKHDCTTILQQVRDVVPI